MKPRRDDDRYEPSLLRRFFTIGQDADGQWRVYHAADRYFRGGKTVKCAAGSLADTAVINGYRMCSLPKPLSGGKQKSVRAHCVIWALYNDENPGQRIIDHEDRNRQNNDPANNLRAVGEFASTINRAQSLSGPICVESRLLAGGARRYRARLTDPRTRKVVTVGNFDSMIEAQMAVDAFLVKHRGADVPTNASLGRLAA